LNERLLKLRELKKAEGQPVIRDKSFDLLVETAKKKQPLSVLEIGVNCGLSGIAILSVSPSARLTGIEIDESLSNEAKENYKEFGVSERAKIFLGDASEIIPVLTGKYDFIFLDGPKGHYNEYLGHLLPLLSVGGVLFADNVLFRGYVFGKKKCPHRYKTTANSMERFLKRVTEDDTLKTEIYDIEDGVSVTVKLSEKK